MLRALLHESGTWGLVAFANEPSPVVGLQWQWEEMERTATVAPVHFHLGVEAGEQRCPVNCLRPHGQRAVSQEQGLVSWPPA